MDHALISGMNFLTVLLMARSVTPSQFGISMLVYTGFRLFQNIQGVLIVEPMSVLAAKTDGNERRDYISGTALAQAGFALATGSVIVVAAIVSPLESLLLAMALAVVFRQLQEFVRRVLYCRLRVASAAMNDVVSYGGQAAVLIALNLRGGLSPTTALLAIVATSALAAALGGWQVRRDMVFMPKRLAWKAMVSNWQFGRWLSWGSARAGAVGPFLHGSAGHVRRPSRGRRLRGCWYPGQSWQSPDSGAGDSSATDGISTVEAKVESGHGGTIEMGGTNWRPTPSTSRRFDTRICQRTTACCLRRYVRRICARPEDNVDCLFSQVLVTAFTDRSEIC